MKRLHDLPFGLRMGATIFALALLLTGTGGLFYYSAMRDVLIDQVGRRLKDTGRTGAYLFDAADRRTLQELRAELDQRAQRLTPEELAAIPEDDTIDSLGAAEIAEIEARPEFRRLVQKLRQIRDGSRDNVGVIRTIPQSYEDANDPPFIRYAYLLTPIPESPDHAFSRFLVDADHEDEDLDGDGEINGVDEIGTKSGEVWRTPDDAFFAAYAGRASVTNEFYTDAWGTWLSAAIPVKDESGAVIAVMGLDYDVNAEASLLRQNARISGGVVFAGVLLSLLLSYSLSRVLSKRLGPLSAAVERLKARDFAAQAPVQSGDELGRLGEAFNSMVQEIRAYSEGLQALNAAFERFVPRELLRHLGHESVLTVQAGDHVMKTMAVLFCDIRSFTTLSESMSPRENFDFLNEYLRRMGPIVRENRGFIDKYIGDGVMALFPESPRDAIHAGVQMQLELALFNAERAERSLAPLSFGIGVHYGPIMLGAVGEDQRIDGTVISDAVNTASRLEQLTKKYRVTLIASGVALEEAAADGRARPAARWLGALNIRGRRERVEAYEVLDGLAATEQKQKLENAERFREGVLLIQSGEREKARAVFEDLCLRYPQDLAAAAVLARLQRIERAVAS